jgi:putative transposase
MSEINQNNEIVCKYCQSANVRKYGTYNGKQIYYCNACNHKFNSDNQLFGMKTPANQVSDAVDMYYKGMSVNDIRDNLNQQYHNNPSSKTVYEWIDKYTNEAIKQFKESHPDVGDTWIADETVLKIGGQNVWMYDIIDEKTRFVLATRITYTRTTHDAEMLMEKAEKRAGKKPKIVITDKQASYNDGIELAYGSDTEHLQRSPFSPTDDTQRIERFHGTLKERTKCMRGLKTIDSANEFVDGYLVYYNYFRPHESLEGKTPAEAAKLIYPIKSWVDIGKVTSPQTKVLVTPPTESVLAKMPPLIRPITHRTYDFPKKLAQRHEHKKTITSKGFRIVPQHRTKNGGLTRRSDR